MDLSFFVFFGKDVLFLFWVDLDLVIVLLCFGGVCCGGVWILCLEYWLILFIVIFDFYIFVIVDLICFLKLVMLKLYFDFVVDEELFLFYLVVNFLIF